MQASSCPGQLTHKVSPSSIYLEEHAGFPNVALESMTPPCIIIQRAAIARNI
jgi:hypothetical protein